MTCHECQEQLVPYAEELLDAATAQAVRDHLAECAACRAEEQATRRVQERLASAGAASKFVSLEGRVLDEIQRRQAELSTDRASDGRPHDSPRRVALRFALAACLMLGVGAALVAWLSRPNEESPDPRSSNHVAVEGRDGGTRGGSQFEAALEALIAVDGGDEAMFNQGMQVCWGEYASHLGDGVESWSN